MKYWRLWIVGILAGIGALTASGRDSLDSEKGRAWSPDGRWLAFNLAGQNDLFIASLAGKRHFLLRPSGDVVLDTSNIVAPGSKNLGVDISPGSTTRAALTETNVVFIASPGRSKLQALEWSPKSEMFAYTCDSKVRALFAILEQNVMGRLSVTNALPWQTEDDASVVFDFERTTKEHPSRYRMRVARLNGTVLREVLFENPKEIARISLLRYTGSSFITPDKKTIIYPHLSTNGWQLVLDDVTGPSNVRPLTTPAEAAPYEWKLTNDGTYLAVVEGASSLSVGRLQDWGKSERVFFTNMTMTVEWNADGRFLACNDKQNLFVLERAADGPKLVARFFRVTDTCNPQFWGWRGTRLFFNDNTHRPADLFCLDVAQSKELQFLIHDKGWRSAPSLRTVSPDGRQFVCLVTEIDGQGRLAPALWRIRLEPNAEWELIHQFPPMPAP